MFCATVTKIDKAFKSFFRRVGSKEEAGVPRNRRRWRTIEINDQCWSLLKREGDKLILNIKVIPCIQVKSSPELPPNTMLAKGHKHHT
ncbi:MAG: hypothetical protein OXF23_05585 [Candidatus Dadabacteria bacterium]|nr:hypothetical protein [Candidatus Dadabacteria bacterium]MCY4262483.1 hypothetical protein [Candidatus Dadabacteria bacterium]